MVHHLLSESSLFLTMSFTIFWFSMIYNFQVLNVNYCKWSPEGHQSSRIPRYLSKCFHHNFYVSFAFALQFSFRHAQNYFSIFVIDWFVRRYQYMLLSEHVRPATICRQIFLHQVYKKICVMVLNHKDFQFQIVCKVSK